MWYNYFNEEARVIGIVHINAEETVVFRNRNWYTKSYRLVELNRFLELLDEKYKIIADEDKETINTTLVAKTVVGCVKPFDLYERVFDMENLRNFK